jgi:EAL domain-containing protein (putative c-di-GMP-specific phosphodiesterase class I)
LEAEALQAAIAADQIHLYGQRIITPQLPRHRIEILSRVESGGILQPPYLWLPLLAADAELACLFDWAVVRSAFALPLQRHHQLWINFSGGTIAAGFADRLGGLLTKSAIAPRQICVEITEEVALGSMDELAKIRRLGCDLALDDVGSGFSNLSEVAGYPLTWLKVDGPLVATVGSSDRRWHVAHRLIQLGKDLRLGVVCEWVESQAQAEMLLRWGCDGFQGFNVPRVGAGTPVPILELLG